MRGNCCRTKLCPFSLGLGIGLTCGLAIFLWSLWLLYAGPTPMMAEYHISVSSVWEGVVLALWGLLKGFIFGFFVALFYDLISCCCKSKWCCKSECACCAGKQEPTK